MHTVRGETQESIVQPAYLQTPVASPVGVGLVLFSWLAGQLGVGQRPVIVFLAREYRPAAMGSLELEFVGTRTDAEVEAICPRLPEVQSRTNDAYDAVLRQGKRDIRPAEFGTAVHARLKDQIDSLFDPNSQAEISFLKTIDETGDDLGPDAGRLTRYGTLGSIRVDVLEHPRPETTCVYDIKTGAASLRPSRSREIADSVFRRFPLTTRIIVTEVRPTR